MNLAATLEAPRWQPLRRFVERWYARPLEFGGSSESELAEAARRLGQPLPAVVREWFSLVGGRLTDVNQDWAVRLGELTLREGRLALWRENQGCWAVEIDAQAADDASVVVRGAPEARPATVTEALLGMVYSDTLVGAWSGRGVGPLGPLRAGVVGGVVDQPSEAALAKLSATPALAVWPNPFFEDPPRGHERLVLRAQGGVEWLAADAEAEREAAALLELGTGGPYVLLVTVADRARVAPHLEGGFGGEPSLRLTSARLRGPAAVLSFETDQPQEAMEALARVVGVEAEMQAGYRPHHTMRFTPCWPKGATTFTAPR